MSYASTVLADGAVGYWRLGESAFGSAAVDAVGNKNGTYTNSGGLTFSRTGIVGAGGDTAVLFTAASVGFVSIGSASAINVGDVCTVEAWVIRASNGAYHTIFGATNGPFLRIDNNNVVSGGKGGSATIVTSSNTVTADSTYHHLVYTKNGATNKIYVDGVDVSVPGGPQTLSNTGYVIGVDGNQSSFAFNGTIDEVALYPTALSAGTVASHYSLGAGTFIAPKPFVRNGRSVFRSLAI